jgi:FkbM family methyltransferase
MHLGEDTGFYLRKGFRVIGFEADPRHAQCCRDRFAQAIAEGQLTVVEGAIVAGSTLAAGLQRVAFYRNSTHSVWGTVNVEWADRNARVGATTSLIEVPAVDFAAVLEAHGIPHYLKIDIEGSDLVCIEALRRFEARPDYLSLESSKTGYASSGGRSSC